nr:unnamed protein product [Naegleria fowleri]
MNPSQKTDQSPSLMRIISHSTQPLPSNSFNSTTRGHTMINTNTNTHPHTASSWFHNNINNNITNHVSKYEESSIKNNQPSSFLITTHLEEMSFYRHLNKNNTSSCTTSEGNSKYASSSPMNNTSSNRLTHHSNNQPLLCSPMPTLTHSESQEIKARREMLNKESQNSPTQIICDSGTSSSGKKAYHRTFAQVRKHPFGTTIHDEKTLHDSNRSNIAIRDFTIQNGSKKSSLVVFSSSELATHNNDLVYMQKKSHSDSCSQVERMTPSPTSTSQFIHSSPKLRPLSPLRPDSMNDASTIISSPVNSCQHQPESLTFSTSQTTTNGIASSSGSKLWKFCSPQTPDSVRQLRIDKQRKMEKINSIKNTPIITKCDVLTGSCLLEWKVSVVGERRSQSMQQIKRRQQFVRAPGSSNGGGGDGSSPHYLPPSNPSLQTCCSSSLLSLSHNMEKSGTTRRESDPALIHQAATIFPSCQTTSTNSSFSPFEPLGSPTMAPHIHQHSRETVGVSDESSSSGSQRHHHHHHHQKKHSQPFTIRTSISIQDLLN